MRIVVYGCGVMGRRVATALLEKRTLELAGAVDIDEALLGRDIGELLEPARRTGVVVTPPRQAPLSGAECVVLTTGSRLAAIEDQIAACIDAGANVVSTCEELAYPWNRNREIAARIDRRARERGVTVVGTGINPGFLMDALPVVLTAPCLSVEKITVTRMMNSARRRLPFQKKVGTGLTPEEFRRKIESGAITGHVGLVESMQLIAAALGWELDAYTEDPPEPVVAEAPVETGFGTVEAGRVIGLVSRSRALHGGVERIRLSFTAHAAVDEEYDEVVIDGVPPIRERIDGGVHGDIGTVAVTVNTAARAVAAPPGLLTMAQLPPPAVTP
jgi:4-hydroxy-tetrahydrodipicolinate reductase